MLATKVRKLLGPKTARFFRKLTGRGVSDLAFYQAALSGMCGIEIGGPSAIFDDTGTLPIYRVLKSLDNCVFSADTVWAHVGATFNFHSEKAPGQQFISEATDLGFIEDEKYDFLLSSHCLEHVANPVRALLEWKRVLKPGGLLLLVVPHKDGTFDSHRPVTSLAHIKSDFEKSTGEDDLTHLEENVKPEFPESREICLNNYQKRMMHHHVFDTQLALQLVNFVDFQILRADAVKPFHIFVLMRKVDGGPENEAFLNDQPEYRKKSPFPSDRQTA